MIDQPLGTVVIGGSQAGLAVGYFLEKRHLPFVILDENQRIADTWRKRWDSLRLFTQEPARAGSRLDHWLTPMLWFVATRFTVKTALGRKLRDHFVAWNSSGPSATKRTLPLQASTGCRE